MPKIISSAEILIFANTNNWLTLFSSEGNILNVFLTPTGNIIEVYFEKNKTTFQTLSSYVCK